MVSGGTVAVSVRGRLTVRAEASVTVMVKVPESATAAVPAMVAVDAVNVNPAGRVPVNANVYGDFPPAAVNFWVYAVPTTAAGKLVGGTVSAAAVAMERACFAVTPPASVTVTVNDDVAAAVGVGVPLMTPVEAASVRPAGSAMVVTAQG